MLSLIQNLSKAQAKDSGNQDLKPVTVVFWSDFMNNPSVMYGLFSSTPKKLNYDPDKVKVMGTKHGMINQINISNVEDLDSIHEELLGMPLLLRVWAEYLQQNAYGDPAQEARWEGDLAMLVDTSHPLLRPELERGLEQARKILQSRRKFCLQIDFGPSIEQWLRTSYPRGCCTLSSVRPHKASLYITNHNKPLHVFDCNALWGIFFGPCWLLSAPCYKLCRSAKCKDLKVALKVPVVRRTVLHNGKIVEIVGNKKIVPTGFSIPGADESGTLDRRNQSNEDLNRR